MFMTEEAATFVQMWIHTHLTHEPRVVVPEKWPKGLSQNALVVLPLEVAYPNIPRWGFSIMPGKLSDDARKALNVLIRLKMADQTISTRNLAAALYNEDSHSSRRRADYMMRELEEAGILRRVTDGKIGRASPWHLVIGRWRPDTAAAKAAGIEVREYE